METIKYAGTQFNVPIVLFSFIREDKILQIIERIKIINPSKIYLISDGGRNELEHKKVIDCRKKIEERIDWDGETTRSESLRLGSGASMS